jgi:D-xylono/L-arabinono-1,4-lactonase
MTIVANANCELAENPLWDAERHCVYWADIPAGKIYRLDVASKKCEVIYAGAPVGGFTIQENGELLLFRVDDIALLKSSGETKSLQPFQDQGSSRFNDVIADPEGRVFAGTIGKTKQSGGLFCLQPDGATQKLFDGTGCSNGMGFSPDLKSFYWTCSTTRRIFQFDYERSSGALTNRRLFYETNGDEGIPDGLAIDIEGCVWSARWGGSSIRRHAKDGKVLETFAFPARNITSLCFGGPDLDELFVTSAKEPGENSVVAGALFHLIVPVRGMKEFRSKLACGVRHPA